MARGFFGEGKISVGVVVGVGNVDGEVDKWRGLQLGQFIGVPFQVFYKLLEIFQVSISSARIEVARTGLPDY